MHNPEPERYANRNLRCRSFRGENLQNMDFSGADIRGCDFSYCNLTGANFAKTLIGKAPKHTLSTVLISLTVIFVTFQAISQMLFGVIDTTSNHPLWNYTLALIISLGIATFSAAMRHWLEHRRIATILSGAASSALIGFYYGGILSNKNPQIAAISAAIAAIIAAVLAYFGRELVAIAIAIAGCMAAYGLTYFTGLWAIIHLSVNSWLWGIILSLLTLIVMAVALLTLQLVYKEIAQYGITSFRGANLINTNFTAAKIANANTKGSVGLSIGE